MSIILDALAKAKREQDQTKAGEDSTLHNELAYRQPSEAAQTAAQRSSGGNGSGTILILAGMLVFLAVCGAAFAFAAIQFWNASEPQQPQQPNPQQGVMLAKTDSGTSQQTADTPPAKRNTDQVESPALSAPAAVMNPTPSPAREQHEPPAAPRAQIQPATVSTASEAAAQTEPEVIPMNFEAAAAPAPTQTETAEAAPAATPAPAPQPTQTTVAAANSTATAPPATAAKPKSGSRVIMGRGKPVQSIDEVKVNGIIWRKDEPKAMILNQVAYIGDDIRGVKILDIQPDHVVVEFQQVEYTLYY